MANFIFANNVSTSLASSVSPSATTIALASTTNLPTSIPAGTYLAITLNDAATKSNFEIVYATARSGAILTVLRGQDGTSALAWLAGDLVYGAVTAGELGNMVQSGGPTPPYVELSPPAAQSGAINVTGEITSGTGVSVGGPLTSATTGSFSGTVTAGGDVDATNGVFSGQVTAPTILQNGIQVVDAITSPDSSIVVSTSGGAVTVKVNPAVVPPTQRGSGTVAIDTAANGTMPATVTIPNAYASAGAYIAIAVLVVTGTPQQSTVSLYIQQLSGSQFRVYAKGDATSPQTISFNWITIPT